MITLSLTAYTLSRDSRITALRASTIFWFGDDDASWTVIEWVEDNGTRSLAIFHFGEPNELGQGSWLMHSGLSVSDGILEKPCWENSRIDWDVADVNHLKILFGVAQHVAGMLDWSVGDAMKLYCERNSEEESTSEYIPFAIR